MDEWLLSLRIKYAKELLALLEVFDANLGNQAIIDKCMKRARQINKIVGQIEVLERYAKK
jgi:hypothetical protein